ncbi:MAG: hypothetical protein ACLGIB_04530 [Actinomycetota bacterium]
MFVRYEKLIDRPFEQLLEAFASPARLWVPQLVQDPTAGTSYVLSELGAGPLAKEVRMHLSDAYVRPGRAVMPMRVVATGPEGLFPELDADLELLETDGGRSKLVLQGTYRSPLGPVGTMLDRKVLYRLRERSLNNFVDQVATLLTRASAAA